MHSYFLSSSWTAQNHFPQHHFYTDVLCLEYYGSSLLLGFCWLMWPNITKISFQEQVLVFSRKWFCGRYYFCWCFNLTLIMVTIPAIKHWYCYAIQVRRFFGQFTPAYWDKDEWNPLQGPVRFLQVLGLVVLILAVEVECFFLKYCLWIPPLNPLVTYRLIIWWLIANPAIREYNTFLQTKWV